MYGLNASEPAERETLGALEVDEGDVDLRSEVRFERCTDSTAFYDCAEEAAVAAGNVAVAAGTYLSAYAAASGASERRCAVGGSSSRLVALDNWHGE